MQSKTNFHTDYTLLQYYLYPSLHTIQATISLPAESHLNGVQLVGLWLPAIRCLLGWSIALTNWRSINEMNTSFQVPVGNTVNVLKFQTFFSFCSQIKCWFSGLEFANILSEQQKGKTLIRLLLQKQSDLGLPFCLGLFGR